MHSRLAFSSSMLSDYCLVAHSIPSSGPQAGVSWVIVFANPIEVNFEEEEFLFEKHCDGGGRHFCVLLLFLVCCCWHAFLDCFVCCLLVDVTGFCSCLVRKSCVLIGLGKISGRVFFFVVLLWILKVR